MENLRKVVAQLEDDEEFGTLDKNAAGFEIHFSCPIEEEDGEDLSEILTEELDIYPRNFKVDTEKNSIYIKDRKDAMSAFERVWPDYQHWRDFELLLRDSKTGEAIKTYTSEE